MGELALDVAGKVLQPAAQHPKILTEVFDSQSVGLGVMAPERVCGCLDQSPSQLFPDLVRAVVNDSANFLHRSTTKRRRSWIARQMVLASWLSSVRTCRVNSGKPRSTARCNC